MSQETEAPKMDLKMMILPAMFFLQKQIDLKDPIILNYVHIALITVAIIGLGTYFFIKQLIDRSKNNTKIWIPPKSPPQIPFLSPPPEPIKPEDYTETTYQAHENKLIMEAIQGVVMSCGIAALMSFKFGIHMSCLMQAVMVPLGLYDNILVQKYIFGTNKTNLYKELLTAPVKNETVTKNDDDDKDEKVPRVEELDEEPTESSTASTKSPTKKQSTSSPSSPTKSKTTTNKTDVHDID